MRRVGRIEINQLTRVFETDKAQPLCALDRLSLKMADREWLVVTGPSGCGKTTLLRLIAGLDEPSSGEILMDGRSLRGVPPQERHIAMVFQEPALYPHMTVRENIGFGLRLRGCSSMETRERVGWAAELLGISECLGRKPIELAGGQRHRVAVARALVRRPELFLFDEPLGSLDAPTREQMRRELLRVCRAIGATVIYVTHDQSEALTMGDRVAVISHGKLQQIDRPAGVYHRPSNLTVARFIGSPPMNLCAGKVVAKGAALRFDTGTWSMSIEDRDAARLAPFSGKSIVLGVRPEGIISAQRDAPGEALEAAIEKVDELGAERWVHLLIGGQPFLARFPAEDSATAPEAIRVRFRSGSLHFFDANSAAAIL